MLAILRERCPDHILTCTTGSSPSRTLLSRAFRNGASKRGPCYAGPPRGARAAIDQAHARATAQLSQYDLTGLIWLLRGRPVAALTEATAAIQQRTGSITVYRRHNKPALGPLGDSLDDFYDGG